MDNQFNLIKNLKESWDLYKLSWKSWLALGFIYLAVFYISLTFLWFVVLPFFVYYAFYVVENPNSKLKDMFKYFTKYKMFRYIIASLPFAILLLFVFSNMVGAGFYGTVHKQYFSYLPLLLVIYFSVRYGLLPYRYFDKADSTLRSAYLETKKVTKGKFLILLLFTLGNFLYLAVSISMILGIATILKPSYITFLVIFPTLMLVAFPTVKIFNVKFYKYLFR